MEWLLKHKTPVVCELMKTFFFQQMQQQNTQKVEASKVPEYIKKAAKKAAEFNSNLNRERMEERRAYFDLQTHVGWLNFLAQITIDSSSV